MTCIAHQYSDFLLDLDGVIYLGNSAIPGAKQTIEKLRQLNKGIRFLTNNPQGTTIDFVKKLNNLGIKAAHEEVFSVSKATASFLVYKGFKGKQVYVIGSAGLKSELRSHGIHLAKEPNLSEAEAVIASVHSNFNYRELVAATNILDRCGILFGTNRDAVRPTEQGKMPGSGSILAAIETASGLQATIIGKPSPRFIRTVVKSLPDSSMANPIIVGDRLDTDIVAGINADISTALVLTGVSSREDVARSLTKPKYIIPSVTYLTQEGKSVQLTD